MTMRWGTVYPGAGKAKGPRKVPGTATTGSHWHPSVEKEKSRNTASASLAAVEEGTVVGRLGTKGQKLLPSDSSNASPKPNPRKPISTTSTDEPPGPRSWNLKAVWGAQRTTVKWNHELSHCSVKLRHTKIKKAKQNVRNIFHACSFSSVHLSWYVFMTPSKGLEKHKINNIDLRNVRI